MLIRFLSERTPGKYFVNLYVSVLLTALLAWYNDSEAQVASFAIGYGKSFCRRNRIHISMNFYSGFY